MIPENYYYWPAAQARDIYLAFERLMIVDCDLGVMSEEKIANWMYQRPICFIMHHEHIQINVITIAYEDIDHARADLIKIMMDVTKVLRCMTISDALTSEEYSQW